MPLVKASEHYAEKFEIVLYGVPGIGKTTLWADHPNVLYLEVDDNGATVLQRHKYAERINVFFTRSWAELADFVAVKLPASQLVKTRPLVVVDTISECQTLERMRQVGASPLKDPKWEFNQNIYTKNNAQVMALMRELKKLKLSVVYNCHMTEFMKGEGKEAELIIRPSLSSKLLDAVQANVDGQFFYEWAGANRILRFQESGEIQTKSRFKSVPRLTNPSWTTLEPILTSNMRPSETGAKVA